MKSGYNELVAERSKVMNLYHDLQRLQQMEGLLRKNLGADLELSGYEEKLGGLVENDAKRDVEVVLFDEKLSLGRPRFDLFSHFGRFSRVRKINVFLITFADD